MSQLSNYLGNALLNAVLRNNPYTSPAAIYVGLFNSNINDGSMGAEVSSGGYQRQPITFTEPADKQVSNNSDILFPIAASNWGTITYIGLFDSQNEGNLLFHGPLEFAKSIDVSSQFKIPRNYLIVRLK